MCYFNNMAIAVQRIRPRAKRVLIIDIDLHFGDGTVSIFQGDHDVKIANPGSVDANIVARNAVPCPAAELGLADCPSWQGHGLHWRALYPTLGCLPCIALDEW